MRIKLPWRMARSESEGLVYIGSRPGFCTTLSNLHHGHLGIPLQDLRQKTGLLRVLVGDNDERHFVLGRRV